MYLIAKKKLKDKKGLQKHHDFAYVSTSGHVPKPSLIKSNSDGFNCWESQPWALLRKTVRARVCVCVRVRVRVHALPITKPLEKLQH